MEWLEIAVPAAPADVESVADALRHYAPAGVSIEEIDGPSARDRASSCDARPPPAFLLKAYLPLDAALARKRRALRRDLLALPLRIPLPYLRGRRVREEDWADAWKEFFGVEKVGRRLVVCPSWRRYRAARGEIVLRLDPGMAFGTGQHPTTRLCLLLLEEHVRPGSRVLDLGTGSGILAIAAALLGAGEALGLDLDPVAIKIAAANAAANGVDSRVTVREGTLDKRGGAPGGYDCVVANISADATLEMAPAMVAALRSGGVVIVSGITGKRADECAAALSAAGATTLTAASEGDWRAIVSRRP